MDRKDGQRTRDAILSMISEDGRVTSHQMAETVGINRSAISKHLKKLQEDGLIQRVGPAKGGRWVVTEKGKNDE